MEDVAQLAAPDAEQHGVTIHRDMPEQRLPVKVDVDLMKQALLNVVINGVQAMPQGGLLTISARRENNAVVAEIRDAGGGIPQDAQDKISNSISPRKKMAAASAWLRPIRFCSGITDQWTSNRSGELELFSDSTFQ